MTKLKSFDQVKLRTLKESPSGPYTKFRQLDGRHPLMEGIPEFHVAYKVRNRNKGKVAYFNFDLGKEMGLVPEDHSNSLNQSLEKEIVHAFGILIINEYDQINNIKYDPKEIREHSYMATRYLQLQHPSKTGKTSGDGRSIWNGTIQSKGQRFDVSSRGTGATCLSPATSLKKKFFKNGDPSISYGCGLCDLDEAIETAFFSEILHQNGVRTERVLAVLEYPGRLSVVVRAYPNLLRPSHFFRYLKQSHYEGLKSLFDYHFKREQENGKFPKGQFSESEKYQMFLQKVVDDFSFVTACFEDEYIFCWLDWDGDNILMDGAIIDYGSIRQFGLFHHEYRYDDVQRFSTSIIEQKSKARYIVQNFAQMIDFLKTKEKKNIRNFSSHWALKSFDESFEAYKDKNILYKIGLKKKSADEILLSHRRLVRKFRKEFSFFERAKSKRGIYKVADGITWDAIFCMRDVSRELPQILLMKNEFPSSEEFIEMAKSKYASKKDVELNIVRKQRIKRFLFLYKKILEINAKNNKQPLQKLLLEVCMRSSIINKYDRVTGNSVTTIVSKILSKKPRLDADQTHELFRDFLGHQLLIPEKRLHKKLPSKIKEKLISKKHELDGLINGLFKIVRDYREGI